MPVRSFNLSARILKGGSRSLQVPIPDHPELRPGINRGKFTESAAGVLIAQSGLYAGKLQRIAGLGNHDSTGMGVNQFQGAVD